MSGYTSREVAKLLGLSVGRVRGFVRSGFLAPERGPRGELRFSFPDLVLLRTAKELIAQRVGARRVRAALRKLQEELPSGLSLSSVSISAEGQRIVVRDGRRRWNPESGQQLFSFEVSEIAESVAPLVGRKAERARAAADTLRAEDWFDLGCEFETTNPSEAREAYRRAIELDLENADAHTNLGRLLHEAGEIEAAEAHYRRALEIAPYDLTAAFNLAVAFEDGGRDEAAAAGYRKVLAADPDYADAHYNLAQLYERLGPATSALRHWQAYRKLVRR
jgi:tetratricopeptide (TPR) repeat protein